MTSEEIKLPLRPAHKISSMPVDLHELNSTNITLNTPKVSEKPHTPSIFNKLTLGCFSSISSANK